MTSVDACMSCDASLPPLLPARSIPSLPMIIMMCFLMTAIGESTQRREHNIIIIPIHM